MHIIDVLYCVYVLLWVKRVQTDRRLGPRHSKESPPEWVLIYFAVLPKYFVDIIANCSLELRLFKHYLEERDLVKGQVQQKERRPFDDDLFCGHFLSFWGFVDFCANATILRERETSTGPHTWSL
jgi:hypothetical protein